MTVKMYLFTLVSQGVSMPGMGGQYAPEYPTSYTKSFGILINPKTGSLIIFRLPAIFFLINQRIPYFKYLSNIIFISA